MSQGVWLQALVMALLVTGCDAPENSGKLPSNLPAKQLDTHLKQQINSYGLTGDPSNGIDIPEISSPRAQLGMQLFFSKTLGGEGDAACVTCHHPMLGGGDNLSLPIGVGARNPDLLGPGRELFGHLPVAIPRNSPTTFNSALWKKTLFHDGRIQQLEEQLTTAITTPDVEFLSKDVLAGGNLVQAQARFPVVSPDEMRGGFLLDASNQKLRTTLAKRLEKNWTEAFRVALGYGELPSYNIMTEQNFSAMIGEYERSQVFTNTPWKHYVEGDTSAISEQAKRGALLFYSSYEDGGAQCVSCHSGDFFTNEAFYNTAMPQIGSGKGNGLKTTADYGCNLVTNKADDKFRFRTPSLINVEVTGPWGHNGAYTSLQGITRHMLNPLDSALNYNPDQLLQKNIHLDDVALNTRAAIDAGVDLPAKPNLLESDTKYLVEFLKTLTDPCVKSRECLSDWIPKATENDPDGKTLHAVNHLGKPL